MNKVMLIGNVGADPQVRYLDNDVCVAQLRVATTERGYTLQNGTQVPDRTEWHTCIFWRNLAKTVEKYVRKGDKLYIEGKLQSRDWVDKQGISRRVTEIMADQMEMLSPKQNASASPSETQPQAVAPTTQPQTPAVESPANNNNDNYPF